MNIRSFITIILLFLAGYSIPAFAAYPVSHFRTPIHIGPSPGGDVLSPSDTPRHKSPRIVVTAHGKRHRAEEARLKHPGTIGTLSLATGVGGIAAFFIALCVPYTIPLLFTGLGLFLVAGVLGVIGISRYEEGSIGGLVIGITGIFLTLTVLAIIALFSAIISGISVM